MLRLFVVALLLLFARVAFAAPPDDDFDARVRAELEAIDPEAVPFFDRANEAREAGMLDEAVANYRSVLDRAPDFVHAKRRLCMTLSQVGESGEAIGLCREALEQEDSPENQIALMTALAMQPSPSRPQLDEAGRLAAGFIADHPDAEPDLIAAACNTAAVVDRLDVLRVCHDVLERVAPDSPELHYFGWILAVADGDFLEAEAELDAAEDAGLDPALVAQLREATGEARPLWWTLAIWGGGALVAWFAAFGVLVLSGVVLSRATLASAESLPTTRTGEAAGSSAVLRKIYATVLLLTCIFYYASIPLMLLTVVAGAGGIVIAILYTGHIPIKLVAIIGIAVFVTIAAVAKSLFVRGIDEDPGERLDLDDHPKLRELLDEVAAKVGTRAVDNVYVTPGVDMAVFERGGMLRQMTGRSERCLVLGVGAVEGMKVGELRAILAHEYGHFSNRDTAGGGFALAVRRSMGAMAEGLAHGGAAAWYNPAWLFVVSFYKLFLRISQGASRLQEILADRWAVFSYGAAAFERGLRHVIDRSVRFGSQADAYITKVVESKAPMRNLYAESDELARTGPAEDEAGCETVDDQIKQALEAEPSPFDSHPRPVDRFRWARALDSDATPGPSADADAWTVVGSREALQIRMTNLVRSRIAADIGVSIPTEA